MNSVLRLRRAIVAAAALVAAMTGTMRIQAAGYVQHNLVSDIPGNATITDPNLVNAWGISYAPSSPFWVSANGSSVSDLYSVAGSTAVSKVGLVVSIPGDGSVTGQVFNGTGQFSVAGSVPLFVFASEDGTISGWAGAFGTTAATMVLASPANVYKGITIGQSASGNVIYAANFHNGSIDVYNTALTQTFLAGSFTDPNLPAGFAPFDVQRFGSNLYITYAMQDGAKHDDVAGPGNGFVDIFDLDGGFIKRLISNGVLNSPWGLAMAPADFGPLSNDLLVGNFGDGSINAFDPNSGAFEGTLDDASNSPLIIDGLWGLTFGNGASAGATNTLFFSAGPDGESHGLFGSITALPEPATLSMGILAGAALLIRRRRR